MHRDNFPYDEYRHVRYEKENDCPAYHDATTIHDSPQ